MVWKVGIMLLLLDFGGSRSKVEMTVGVICGGGDLGGFILERGFLLCFFICVVVLRKFFNLD